MKIKHLLQLSASLCCLFIAVNPICAQPLAFATNNHIAGNAPDCVVATNVNNCGKVDLISANDTFPGALTVLSQIPGPPPLTAFAPSTYTVGRWPASAVAADINGDGKLDLICANSWDNTLTVLTNDGNGGFGYSSAPGVGDWPTCVVAADVNSDGKVDLIVANQGGLTVLTNNGNGGFGSSTTLSTSATLTGVIAGDVNSDGKPDLICADTALTVFTNNGSGGFGSYSAFNAGPSPLVVAGDINGDGKLDLICTPHSRSLGGQIPLTILTNNGSGRFGTFATFNFGYLPGIWMVDINNDGKTDLIYLSGSTLTVLTNNGSGSFGTNATLNVSGSPRCAMADVNNDGKLDFICANEFSDTIVLFTNNGSGGFAYGSTLTVGMHPQSVVVADVNNDGRLDLISVNGGEILGSTIGSLTLLTQVIVGPPKLSLISSSNTAAVSWSSFSTGFRLQTNSDLSSTNWGFADYPISISSGTNQSVTVTSPSPDHLFFRLQQ